MTGRTLTDAEKALWQSLHRPPAAVAASPRTPRATKSQPPSHETARKPLPPLEVAPAPSRRKGVLHRPQAVIDLHGDTQAEAHRRLLEFVARACQQGHREVLIVTGKGRGGEGVLRRLVPGWLEASPFRPHIQSLTLARLEEGGEGAMRLRFRKRGAA